MSITHRAAKGRRKAMKAIAADYQAPVFHIAQCLLLDADLAAAATAAAFKDLWSGLKAKSIPRDETPLQYTIIRVASHCRDRISKGNPKAFRLPPCKNFLLSEDMTANNQHSTEVAYLLSNLPAIQRFVFVLHTLGELTVPQIVRALGLEHEAIQAAMDAEKANLQRLQKLSRKGFQSSYEQIVDTMAAGQEQVQLPRKALEQIGAAIDHIATPLEQKRRKHRSMAAIITGCCCLVVAVAVASVLLLPKLLSNAGFTKTNSTQNGGTTTSIGTENLYTPPALDESLTYFAEIDIKNQGKITVKLDHKNAPITVANFVDLAQSGFYDGLTFHRIIEGFMMQGGDPQGNGYGGSDNNIVGEFSSNGYDNPLSHTRGAISMARSKAPNSASSQFFIMHQDRASLDGDYAVFGYVTQGMDVVDKICESARPSDNNGTIPAGSQPVIKSITITTEG